MPSNDNAKTKAERREAARKEAMALRAAQERKDKRNRIITLSALVAGLAALAVIVVFVFMQGDDNEPAASSSSSQTPYVAGSPKPVSDVTAPTTADANGGFPVGKSGAAGTENAGAVRVDVYLDFMCPLCGHFEQTNGPTLDDLRTSGEATVIYHPIAILDAQSQGSGFSSRSASAAAYIADKAPDKFMAFNTSMFEHQPEEGSTGLTDVEMEKIAKDVGVPADVAAKIGDGTATATYGDWVTAQTAADAENTALESSQGFGTPTITINGTRWEGDWTQDGALTDAVNQAAGK